MIFKNGTLFIKQNNIPTHKMSVLNETAAVKMELDDIKGAQEPESIKCDIVNMLEQMSRFKQGVSKYMNDNYVDFLPNNSSVYIHLEEGKRLEEESSELLRSLEWVHSNAELKATVENLRYSLRELEVTNCILAADEIFHYVEEANSTNEYMVTLDLLKKLNALIHSSREPEVQTILQANSCYDTICVKYLLQFHLVKSNIKDKFERLLQFSEKQQPNLICSTIQVSKDVNQLQDTVLALFQAQHDVTDMCDFLMDKCLAPIITKPVTISFLEESSEYIKLQISYSTSATSKHDYKQVFENIKLLFNCLENVNILVSDNHRFFGIIGDNLKDRFLKLLIDECLMDAIPESFEDYQSSSLVEDILHFEHLLADLFIINREVEHTLRQFTERFDTLFRNRYFRCILDSGREIMKKDLQDMAPLAEKNTPEDVANNPLLFPKCMVSKSVLDFVKLLNRISRHDNDNPDEDSRLLSIISILLNTYMNLVPQFHKEPLESLPQPAMLFYNNCLFLHHWMANNFGIPTVASLVKNLLATGNKHLRNQVSKQLHILKNILHAEGTSAHNNNTIQIAMVRKCLVHLKLLESLWQHVLPLKLYHKIMGELVSNCCYSLNQNLITKETLSALERKTIVDSMNLFKCQAECFFKDAEELRHLNDWLRLINLLKILEASLPEIVEMWCTGSVSENVKPEEVVHLIRSLHSNTERRALALNKIC